MSFVFEPTPIPTSDNSWIEGWTEWQLVSIADMDEDDKILWVFSCGQEEHYFKTLSPVELNNILKGCSFERKHTIKLIIKELTLRSQERFGKENNNE